MHGYWQGLVAERRQRARQRPDLADPAPPGGRRGALRRRDRRLLLAAARRLAEHHDEHDQPLDPDARAPRRTRAARLAREPGRWPPRARGAAALRVAGAGARAHDHARGRAARHDAPGRRAGAAALRLGQPRRARLPEPRDARPRARRALALGLRPRHPPLPRQRRRAARDPRRARRCCSRRSRDWDVDEPGVVLNQLVPTRGVAHAPLRSEERDGPRRFSSGSAASPGRGSARRCATRRGRRRAGPGGGARGSAAPPAAPRARGRRRGSSARRRRT